MSDQPQTQAPNQTPASTTPPKPTIIGGPEGNTPAPQESQTPVTPAVGPATTGKPVIIGDRVFTDQAEAIKFANDLAQERARYLQTFNNPAPVAPAPIQQPNNTKNKIPLHQLLFEEPEAALAELESNIRQKIMGEQVQQNNERNIWENFYQQNPDLKGLEDIVNLQMQKNRTALTPLSVNEGLKFVAASARDYVSKIRGTANPGERVPNASTQVAGASGAPAQRAEIQANKPSTFFDELKDFRNSKKTKQSKGA